MRSIDREIVSAVIFSKDGKIFQGKQDPKKGGVYLGCWHIPGGGIEDGEDRIQALIREIKEETGIDISQYDIELIDDQQRGESVKTLKGTGEKVMCRMKFYVYKVIIHDKIAEDVKVSLDDDLREYRWVDPNNLEKDTLTPPSIVLFTNMGYLRSEK